MTFFLSYVILAEIFSLAALSTNLLVGVIGIFSVSQAAIMGIGAYTVALLMMSWDLPFLACLAIAVVLCAATNLLLSLPALRVSGDYFVVTSFGCQLVVTAILINWSGLTGGASGLFGIPPSSLAGYTLEDPSSFVLLSTAVLLAGCLAYRLVMHSPFGRIATAVRQDEQAVSAAGRSVLRAKLSMSAISGGFAGAAGGLYCVYVSFIDPTSFDLNISILILAMLVVGGARTLAGAVIGPFLLMALPQLLGLIDMPSTLVGPARQFIYGALLVAFMLFRPQGLAGRRL